jgi:hypothetical protein
MVFIQQYLTVIKMATHILVEKSAFSQEQVNKNHVFVYLKVALSFSIHHFCKDPYKMTLKNKKIRKPTCYGKQSSIFIKRKKTLEKVKRYVWWKNISKQSRLTHGATSTRFSVVSK